MDSPSEDAAWVTLARVIKTQGRRGELAADILSDLPGRFAQLRHVWLVSLQGRRQAFELRAHWFHKGRVILQLASLEDLSAAGEWVGAQVQVPAADRPAAPPGSYFLDELQGCQVWDGDTLVGTVRAVELVPGGAPLLHVDDDQHREHLIPFAEPYLNAVSPIKRRIQMQLPEGLLELE